MARPYPYKLGAYQPATGKQPGLEELSFLCRRRWRFRNFGTWSVRNMKDKPYLSVHATGNACDLGYGHLRKGREKAVEACKWLTRPDVARTLGIVAVHDYAATPPRAWKCDRDAWKDLPNGELGPGGRWLHVEIAPNYGALSSRAYRALWKSLPRP
jgi:hypothetical protein